MAKARVCKTLIPGSNPGVASNSVSYPHLYANGIDNSEVKFQKEKPKGIGNSVTLPEDISNIDKLEEILLALTEQEMCIRDRY